MRCNFNDVEKYSHSFAEAYGIFIQANALDPSVDGIRKKLIRLVEAATIRNIKHFIISSRPIAESRDNNIFTTSNHAT